MVSVAKAQSRVSATDWAFTQRLRFWAEVCWLSAIATVPLLFSFNGTTRAFEEPKTYALHFFALILLGMLVWTGVNRGVSVWQARRSSESLDLWPWIRQNPANLLLSLIAIFSFGYVLSALLSPVPMFSILGADPETTGYNLYTFLSMIVVSLAIVVYATKPQQIWRVIYAIAIVGVITSIYGILQSNGWDPIGVVDQQERVISSFGNPIYFGAYLVIAIPLTASLIVRLLIPNIWVRALVISVMLSIEVLALWLTGSRGPLIGLGGGVLAAVVAIGVATPARLVTSKYLFIAGILVAGPVITILLIAPRGGIYSRPIQLSGEFDAVVDRLQNSPGQQDVDEPVTSEPVTIPEGGGEQLSGVSPVPLTSDSGGFVEAGLSGRTQIWTEVFELATTWERQQPDRGISKVLRPVFGYGPDMLRYSTPLVSEPRVSMQVVDQAHNKFLQYLAELGWSGLFVFIAVLVVLLWMLTDTLRSIRGLAKTDHDHFILMAVGITGAIAGNTVEQLTGVGRISDLFAFWLLVSMTIVLYRIVTQTIVITNQTEIDKGNKQRGVQKAIRHNEQYGRVPAVIATSIFAVLAVVLFYSVDIGNLRGSILGVKGASDPRASTGFVALRDAQELAPNYEFLVIESTDRLLQESRLFEEQGDTDSAVLVVEEARNQLLDFHSRNPLALATRVMLANVASRRVELGVPNSAGEMVASFEDLAEQFPNEGNLLSAVGAVYLIVGRNEDAVAMADRAIEIERTTRGIQQAWWVRATALTLMGDERGAAIAHLTAITRGPESELAISSHYALADAYEADGDNETAELHRQRAETLEEQQTA